jgi:hypothetical protein
MPFSNKKQDMFREQQNGILFHIGQYINLSFYYET